MRGGCEGLPATSTILASFAYPTVARNPLNDVRARNSRIVNRKARLSVSGGNFNEVQECLIDVTTVVNQWPPLLLDDLPC